LTPIGLRSLAPGEPGYRARYEGGVRERDSGYHQGTVWPWLIRPFVEAWLRVRGDTSAARQAADQCFLSPLREHLGVAGLGHISEIADAEPPHRPGGCPFQAWSLGEFVRASRLVEDRIVRDGAAVHRQCDRWSQSPGTGACHSPLHLHRPRSGRGGPDAAPSREEGIPIDDYRLELVKVERAFIDGEEEGFAAIHVRRGSGEIVGATLVAAHAGEMISEMTLAMTHKLPLEALAETVHCYPTQAECSSGLPLNTPVAGGPRRPTRTPDGSQSVSLLTGYGGYRV
jgi:Amylo-alpha-1,6-glucosidase/Pyridine nucleotide-disulphide oxidoreductase, dimerisation domain